MDGNKVSRMYIIDRFYERTNKKVTFKQITWRVVKKNQRKYGHNKTVPYTLFNYSSKVFRFVGRNISISPGAWRQHAFPRPFLKVSLACENQLEKVSYLSIF